MIIRRYINGKRVDMEVNTTPPNIPTLPNPPSQPIEAAKTSAPMPPPTKKGCGCKRK
jgi:hypothetical protein